MKKKYGQTLNKILHGEVAEAAVETHGHRDGPSSADEHIERSLLAIRLALKAGNFLHSPESLRPEQTQNIFLQGEIYFVHGSYFGMTSRHDEAMRAYAQAAKSYELVHNIEKQTLSLFNELIARSYSSEFNLELEQSQLKNILSLCQEHNISKVEFLCQRHGAYRLYERRLYQESLEALLPWVARKDILTKSDSELSLLHIADCYWELRDLRQALHYFDQVPALHDERVRFPKALIEAKLWQKALDIHAFSFITDHWRNRFSQWQGSQVAEPRKEKSSKRLTWHQATGVLNKGSRLSGKIKPQTLEGHMLRLLAEAPRSRSYLCETLWPAQMETPFLVDRFHQLVQRLQRKTNGLIEFDGQNYKLKESLLLI